MARLIDWIIVNNVHPLTLTLAIVTIALMTCIIAGYLGDCLGNAVYRQQIRRATRAAMAADDDAAAARAAAEIRQRRNNRAAVIRADMGTADMGAGELPSWIDYTPDYRINAHAH